MILNFQRFRLNAEKYPSGQPWAHPVTENNATDASSNKHLLNTSYV